VNIAGIAPWYRVKFQTKLDQAAAMVEWLAGWLNYLEKTLWVVVDGAYAKKPFLKRALKAGATVVSRLRKDAALWSVPEPVPPGKRGRGRPRQYGAERLSLAKRAGHAQGWTWATFLLYGAETLTCYKTFLATYKPAGGLICVVLVREECGAWRAYFCTAPEATVAEILEAVADRAAIEQNFHDVKEVHGAGGYGMLVGPAASRGELDAFRAALLADPARYIAQPTLSLSTCPTFVESGIAPRHIDLRPFVLSGKSVQMVPGGLTRVALKQGSLVVNSSQGGGTKDTWVLEA